VARSKGGGARAGRREARAHGHASGDEHRRVDRVAHEIQRVLSDMLVRRTSDPRLAEVAITAVRVTPDLRLARAYFTLLDDRADRAEIERALRHATPFLKRGVAEGVSLRYVPELVFAYDTALAGARRIDSLLREVRPPEAAAASPDEAAAAGEPGDAAADDDGGDDEPQGTA
jgi:ribosome-binding factor A